jgi:3-oxoacyl-[acyl-carrier-protein] synthase-3
MGKQFGILGVGSYVPEKVLTNADLERMVETSDEWIVQRSGIRERRVVSEGETCTGIATRAARAALQAAGVEGGEVGLVVVATSTPDYYTPATACGVAHGVGAAGCAAFDLGAACTGFVYGLVTARQFLAQGFCKYALVVASETLSRFLNWKDRKTCILFGDGAGAAVLGPVPEGYGLLSECLGSDGSLGHLITIPGVHITAEDLARRGGVKQSTVWQDGARVLKFASRTLCSALERALDLAGLGLGDVDLLVPHQANIRIIENAARHIGIGPDRLALTIGEYGNTSSASIPMALAREAARRELVAVGAGGGEADAVSMASGGGEADAGGMAAGGGLLAGGGWGGGSRLRRGAVVAMVAFGAGLTYGACVARWH